MLIRPEDMTVAAVNNAFAQAYGRFRFEGRKCWEALHRAGPCPKSGLACPLATAEFNAVGVCSVGQTLYSSARVTELIVTARAVFSADGKPVYWLEVLKSESDDAEPFRRGTVGVSAAHNRLMRMLEKAASEDVPYLIYGEAGLGKELYARTVHENSMRASRPFVVANGQRLNAKDAEALLLGDAEEPGLLRRADGGTLYVDGVHRASPRALELLHQAALTGRLPGGKERLDVRLAASALNEQGDAPLTALLARHGICVPPLRERKEDIAPLAKFFISGIAPVNTRTITQEAIECLRGYDWPGNMRELKKVLLKAAEAAGGSTITSAALTLPAKTPAPFVRDREEIIALADIKERYLLWAVENFQGSRSELAAKLGVSERTLYRLYARGKQREKTVEVCS